MKYIFFLCLLIGYSTHLTAQKPILDQSAIMDWPRINDERICNDGRYVTYTISSDRSGTNSYIRSTDNLFKKEFPGAWGASFTEDSRRMIFLKPGDSLCILDLGTKEESDIAHVRSFKLPEEGNGKWLAYQLTTNELVLQDFFSGTKKIYPGVQDFNFSKSGKVLLLQTESGSDSNKRIALQWVDLASGSATSFWQGENIRQITFDRQESQLAFLVEDGHSDKVALPYTLWHYQAGNDSAQRWVDDQTPGMEKEFMVSGDENLKFTGDGQKILFWIRHRPDSSHADPEAASVDIWNYKDEWLQSEQLENVERDKNRSFRASVNAADDNVIRLQQDNDEDLWGDAELDDGRDGDFLLTATKVNRSEGYRRFSERPDISLVSIKDGTHTCIQKQSIGAQPQFSPGRKYVWWYDPEKKAYYTYSIQDGVTRNISSKVPVPLSVDLWDVPGYPFSYEPAVWLQQDRAILLYDRYDIWQVDPEGIKVPVNITNGYGRKHKTVLRYVYVKGNDFLSTPAIKKDEKLLLDGFDETNKYNGFFQKQLGAPGNPIPLILSPAVFYYDYYRFIRKAKQADTYLVKRMSATEYPNLQVTKDFTSFRAMSELEPQKKFNWMTSELVKWTTFDGRPGEGILYKPENFDPSRKYPIIFYFYERMTTGLNRFIDPELSISNINIPWFVSRGYLVFCPDIFYRVGEPGQSVYNYVVSAAQMMARKPWVDGKRMGIQGHSWGGYEVNYLITRTGLFAAAASAAGPTDFVSICGTLGLGGSDGHAFTEQAQDRMGASLWQNPKAYIRNSPIFGADKVTTPLLIFHCKRDENVPWAQGVEFFTALRRLDKPSWMLQYDEGDHRLETNKDMIDYTIRLGQFFDHFLKGAPAPKWMTEGIPARLKGIDSGLELSSTGNLGPEEQDITP